MSAAILSGLLALLPAPPADVFAPPFAVTADGVVIDKPATKRPYQANGFPWLADIDGDAKPDLLVGQASNGRGKGGQFRIYRNVGEPGRPRFGSFTWFDDAVPTGRIPDG